MVVEEDGVDSEDEFAEGLYAVGGKQESLSPPPKLNVEISGRNVELLIGNRVSGDYHSGNMLEGS